MVYSLLVILMAYAYLYTSQCNIYNLINSIYCENIWKDWHIMNYSYIQKTFRNINIKKLCWWFCPLYNWTQNKLKLLQFVGIASWRQQHWFIIILILKFRPINSCFFFLSSTWKQNTVNATQTSSGRGLWAIYNVDLLLYFAYFYYQKSVGTCLII